jgi:GT2 family glycosyltransferase
MYLIKERLHRLRQPSGIDTAEPTATVEPLQIYAAHGAFLAFRKSYFEAGGTLRHGAFLFGEEIFVAETVRRLGLTIGYDPRLRVFHRGYTTTGYMPSRQMATYMREAARYCADTWFSE